MYFEEGESRPPPNCVVMSQWGVRVAPNLKMEGHFPSVAKSQDDDPLFDEKVVTIGPRFVPQVFGTFCTRPRHAAPSRN